MSTTFRARVLVGISALALVLSNMPLAEAKSRSGFGGSKSYSSSSYSKRSSSSSYSSSRSSSRSSSYSSGSSSGSGSKKADSYTSRKSDSSSVARSYSVPKKDTSSSAGGYEPKRSGFTSGYRTPSKDSSSADRQATAEQLTAATPKPKTGFGSSTTAKVAAGTALGAALYSATESKAATETYNALKAEQATPVASESKSTTSAATSSPAAHMPTVYRAPAQDKPMSASSQPAPAREVHHYNTTVRESNGGSGDFLTGYLVGAMLSHDNDRPVVVNSAPAPASETPVVQPSPLPSVSAVTPVPPKNVTHVSPTVGSNSGGLPFLVWLIVLPAAGIAAYSLYVARQRRIALATPKSNYSL